eukprot:15183511-Heterocapsa_arctica.AAC.1
MGRLSPKACACLTLLPDSERSRAASLRPQASASWILQSSGRATLARAASLQHCPGLRVHSTAPAPASFPCFPPSKET